MLLSYYQASSSSTSNVGGRDARGRGKGERSGLGKVKRKMEDDEVTLTQIARKVGRLEGGQDEEGEGDDVSTKEKNVVCLAEVCN